jgi:peptide/nickel transport system substrate-binding protein
MRFLLAVLAALSLASMSCRKPEPRPAEPRSLRVLMGADVVSLDPQVPFDDVSSLILDNIFESLVRFDRSFRLSSGLAVRWINPDDRTWRFFLDSEARFPDGSPLKASDVSFSIERLRSLSGSQMSGFTRHIVSTQVVDDLTIDIHTDTPIAILNSLAFIPVMSEKQVKEAGEGVSNRPFGTGAYRLARWEKGKLIVLEANPHHRPAPAIGRAEFVIHDAPDLLEDVLKTHPDITLFFTRSKIEELEKRKPPDLKVVSGGGLAVWYVALNVRPQIAGVKGPNPLADVRVRRAIAQATDQDEMVRDGLRGFGRRATQLVVSQVFGFDPLIEPVRYDPAAARAALVRAGHPDLEVAIDTIEGGTQRIEKLLTAQWQRAGIRASLRPHKTVEYQRALDAGEVAVSLGGYSCTSADASELLSFLLRSRDVAKGYGVGNVAAWSNREVDRVSEDNLRTFDPKKRLETLQRALRLASEELPYLPLYAAADIYVLSDAVDWTPPINQEMHIQDIRLRAPGEGH